MARAETGVGTFTRVHQVLGYLSKLDVQVLGCSTQNVEGLVGRDALSFHEDP